MADSGVQLVTSPIHIEKLEAWVHALAQQAALIELLVLAVCLGLAWLLTSLVRRATGAKDERSILFGRQILDGVMFPVLLL